MADFSDLELKLPIDVLYDGLPDEIDLDGFINQGIHYIGSFRKQEELTYTGLASLGGALCKIQVKIIAPRLWEGDNS